MKRYLLNAATSLLLGTGLMLLMIELLNPGAPAVWAAGSVLYVAPGGADTSDCTNSANPCATVQYAVDQAGIGAEIRVATGVYTDVTLRDGIPQMVYISKTVTIRGGYTPAFTGPPDPIANPTTLDAQGQGRVLYITGDISPTIEGLRITGGDATGLGGHYGEDAGGGIYAALSTATISSSLITSNTAPLGGGLFLYFSNSTIDGNTIVSNTAWSSGGGLYLYFSPAQLSRNLIAANSASDCGGGLCAIASGLTLEANTISGNAANTGGGVAAYYGNMGITLTTNTIRSNAAIVGGGVYLESAYAARLANNILADNRASQAGPGLYVLWSTPVLINNTLARNSGGDGSGVYVHTSVAVLTNTILVSHPIGVYMNNQYYGSVRMEATLWGSGQWANGVDWAGAGPIVTGTLNVWGDPAFVDPASGNYHIGLASAAIDQGVSTALLADLDGQPRPQGFVDDIGADEIGLAVRKQVNPAIVPFGLPLTYTIEITNFTGMTMHAVVTDFLPGSVIPSGTLTWAPTLSAPGGSWKQTIIVTPVVGYSGLLTNVVRVATSEGPQGGYTVTSATPITSLAVINSAQPVPIKSGSAMTYFILVTNTGNLTLTASVTELLPAQVTPHNTLVWTPTITAPGGIWRQTVPVTVAAGYRGALTNTVRVTAREGASGVFTSAVWAVGSSSPERGIAVAQHDSSQVLELGFDWMKVYDPPLIREPVNVLIRLDATATHLANLAAFDAQVRQIASYYGKHIEAYQIGNEVNLNANGWEAPPNAADYVQVLCTAYHTIKQIDPSAIVVSAGLAPTGRVVGNWNGHPGHTGQVQDEREFLKEFIGARGGHCLDVVGYHPIGFSADYDAQPDVNGGAPQTNCTNGFCFRGVEKIYEIMQARDLGHKQVWATEVGWIVAPPDNCLSDPRWQGRAWQIVTPEKQADNLVGAFHYARTHWPWLGAMFVFNLNFNEAVYYDTCEQMRYYSVQGRPSETALSQPHFLLTQNDSPDPVASGGRLTYTMTVLNYGLADATHTVISDVLDSRVSFNAASDQGAQQSGVVLWNAGTLLSGQTVTRTVSVNVTDVISGAVLSNKGSVRATPDVSASQTITTTVIAPVWKIYLPVVLRR